MENRMEEGDLNRQKSELSNLKCRTSMSRERVGSTEYFTGTTRITEQWAY